MPHALSALGLPQTEVQIGDRRYRNVGDRAVVALLTCATWVLQQLPGQVVEEQRDELVKTLAGADDLVVEVHVRRPAVILVRDGARALVKIPAGR